MNQGTDGLGFAQAVIEFDRFGAGQHVCVNTELLQSVQRDGATFKRPVIPWDSTTTLAPWSINPWTSAY
jgi:hypothetical protein